MTLEACFTLNFMNKKFGSSKRRISHCKDLNPLKFKSSLVC